MISLRIFNRRAGAVLAVAGLVFASTLPTMVAADTVTSRSISLSSSVKNTASVTYEVKFTAQHSGTGAFILDFCDTAAINTTCATAGDTSGFTAAGVGTSGTDTVSAVDANTVKVVLDTVAGAGDPVDVVLTGIHNPTAAGVSYARIVTYANDTDASAYISDDINNGGANNHYDDGAVALSFTDGFGVSGRVAETMKFCAGGSTSTITTGCTGTINDPNLTLGTNGILDTTPSTGTIKTQISTNALGGAVVYLKSDSATCGGLVREGTGTVASRCGIAPITTPNTTSTISGAFFGLKLGNLGGALSTTTAPMAVGGTGVYDTSNYYMHYVNGDASGVTGPYGDPLYKSAGPVSDGTADLTFGAAISGLTPAGNYKAAFNLIATGTF